MKQKNVIIAAVIIVLLCCCTAAAVSAVMLATSFQAAAQTATSESRAAIDAVPELDTAPLSAPTLALPSPTVEPSPTPSPAQPASDIVLKDDFETENGLWRVTEHENGARFYRDGAYVIRVDVEYIDLFSQPDIDRMTDVIIQVEATRVAGTTYDNYGLICRGHYNFIHDTAAGYQFMISSNGNASIEKFGAPSSPDDYVTLAKINSNVIKGGQKMNVITASCIGNELTLFVNGNLLLSVEDDEFSLPGEVALLAGTYDTPGVEVEFDNLLIKKP